METQKNLSTHFILSNQRFELKKKFYFNFLFIKLNKVKIKSIEY